jgi:hypothetical protein
MGTMGNYRVKIVWDDGRLTSQCDCPYPRDFCKHAAAVAWGWLNEPESFVSAQTLTRKIESLTREEINGILIQFASRDPESVLTALAIAPKPRGGFGAIERLTENMSHGSVGSTEWLTAWRRILGLLTGEDFQTYALLWDRLIEYGIVYLKTGEHPPETCCDYFEQTLGIWGKNAEMSSDSPSGWWEAYLDLYRESSDERRQRLQRFLRKSLDEPKRRVLADVLERSSPGDWSLTGLRVGLSLENDDQLSRIAREASDNLEHTLILLDAFTDWQAWDWLKHTARESLRRCSQEDKFLFRERLAPAHLNLGEPRQALSLLLTNFKERPGWKEYLELVKVAEAAHERVRALKESRDALIKMERWELLAQVLIVEGDWEALERIAVSLPSASPWLVGAARQLRGHCPDSAKELYQRSIRFLIQQGTRRAAKEAIPYLTEFKRLCREAGWNGEWEAFRTELNGTITDPVALRMMGSLLVEERKNEDGKHIMEAKGD